MSIRLKYSLPALLQLSAVVLAASPSMAASWQTISDYGGGSVKMTLYVPDKVDASPGIVVSLHYCGGNEGNAQGWFKSQADKYGFIVIAPKSQGNCWDAAPGRSGEKAAVAKMVEYVLTKNNADKAKVFAAGASSGACMTNALLASYPDVFAGGSVLSGVPAGGWTSGGQYVNSYQQASSKDAKAWGDIVRNAFSFSGTRPRVQLWHGTSDELINYGWLAEEVKQWTNVMGLSAKSQGQPPSGWTTQDQYKDANGTVMLEVNIGNGKVHDLTQYNPWDAIVAFFGLDKDTPSSGGTGGAGGTSSTSGSSIGTGGKASVGGAGGSSASSKAASGGAGGAASNSQASSSSAKATGGTAATAAGGTNGKGSSANEKGGNSATSSKVSSKGGASAKGGASSVVEEEGGAASSTDETSSGGSDAEQSSAVKSKGGSTQKASSSKIDSSSQSRGGAAATTANAQQSQTPPDDGGGCSFIAHEGGTSRGALAGLAAVLIGLASSRRRRRSN